ncbi:MAG: hypothetical protein AB7S74_02810 [Hyphomicrobium sp.]
MQRISGLFLIFSGLILGVYTFLPPPFDGEQALREMTRISAAPDRSDQAELAAAQGGGLYAGRHLAIAAPAALRLETGAVNKPSVTWSAIVTNRSGQGRITSSKPGDRETRAQLARDLQVELKRVGCYSGEINGGWTQSTKRAMRAFMDRVNATLPYDAPDYILLTLVQGHSAKACGVQCPSTQTLSSDGRCLPNAILASRSERPSQRVVATSNDAGSRTASSPDTRRRPDVTVAKAPVLVSGPKLITARAATARTAGKSSEKQVVAQATERLPWLNDDGSSRRRVSRPEGMMGVGGPRDYDATQPPASATITPPPGRVRLVTLESELDNGSESAAPTQKTQRTYAEPDEIYEPAQPSKRATSKSKYSKSAKRSKATAAAAKKAKSSKYSYYAGNGRHRGSRRGSPAFIMQQAMGGIF